MGGLIDQTMDPYVYVDAFAGVECGVISAATSFHVVPFPARASGSQAMKWLLSR